MTNYNGKKFRPLGTTSKVHRFDQWGEMYTVEVQDFVPTRKYKEFLHQKRVEEMQKRFNNLKKILEHDYNTLGYVDDSEYNEMMTLYKLLNE